jgi:hypothetical protein
MRNFSTSLRPWARFGAMASLLWLSACGGNGGGNSPAASPENTNLAQPEVTLTASGIKALTVSWRPVEGATAYRLQYSDDGSNYTLVGPSTADTVVTVDIPVHLLNWTQGRYRVQACNADGCRNSAATGLHVDSRATIGYFKAPVNWPYSNFGSAMALSTDGRTMALSRYADGAASYAVVIYVRTDVGWVMQRALQPSPVGQFDGFGVNIALSGDGNTLAVGANTVNVSDTFRNSGAVFVFTRNAGQWAQQARLTANVPIAKSYFGHAIGLSKDGHTLAVGAFGGELAADHKGSAYIFQRTGSAWAQTTLLVSPTPTAGLYDEFGSSIAISGDGKTVGVGAIREQVDNAAAGQVHVFALNPNSHQWVHQAAVHSSTLSPFGDFGAQLSLSEDGTLLAVGAQSEYSIPTATKAEQPHAGSVHVFALTGQTWSHQVRLEAPNADGGDMFGMALSLSDDGSVLAVGAPNEDGTAAGVSLPTDNSITQRAASGAAYVFVRKGSTWGLRNYLKATNPDPNDLFGKAVGLSGDGLTLAVGAPEERGESTGVNGDQTSNKTTAAGAVYLY